MPTERPDQIHDSPPDQRLAPGQPEFPDAATDECRRQPVNFLQAQNLCLRQEGHMFRHAVNAAEIAAISDRNAQITDPPSKGIDERCVRVAQQSAGLEQAHGRICAVPRALCPE